MNVVQLISGRGLKFAHVRRTYWSPHIQDASAFYELS